MTDAPPPSHAPEQAATSIHLRSRRAERAERLLPLRDAVAAFALAWSALPRFQSGQASEVALAAADVVVAAALVGTIVHRNVNAARHHARVEWIDVAAGVMLLVEAYHQRHEGRPGRLLPYATALLALLSFAKGFFHERFAARSARRRTLRLDADGMRFDWSRLHHVSVRRRDVAAIATSEREIVVTAPNGSRRRISLRDAVEPAVVAAAVRDWARREGVALEP